MSKFITNHKLFPFSTNGKSLITIHNILTTNLDNHILFVAISLHAEAQLRNAQIIEYRKTFDVLEEKEVDGYLEMRLRCKNKEDLMRWQLNAIKETIDREYQEKYFEFCIENKINPIDHAPLS